MRNTFLSRLAFLALVALTVVVLLAVNPGHRETQAALNALRERLLPG